MRQRLLISLTVAVVTTGELATLCPAQTTAFPYSEGFESAQLGSLPAGWNSTRNVSADTLDFKTATTNPHGGQRAVGSVNARISQSLTSILFNFSSTIPESLIFWNLRSSTHTARMLVEASLDSGATFPLQLSDSLRYDTTGYRRIALPLPQLLSSTNAARFRWRIVGDPTSGTGGTLRIDDITVTTLQTHDITVSSISFQPIAPVEGDSVSASAKIINVGLQSAQNFSAEFYVDANNDSIPQPSELRATIVSSRILAVSDSIELSANLGPFPAGQKLVMVKVVYGPDQNLSNNQRHAVMNVGYSARSVIINEIMYAPTSPEPEWVELFNTRSDSISLKNWFIADSNRVLRVVTTQEMKVAPGGYIVLTGNPSALLNIHPNIISPILGVASFPALNNGADAVILYDSRSVAMDSVRYSSSWGGSTGGRSLERIDPLGPSTLQVNWGTSRSTNRSTPGERNSVTRKDRDLAVDSLQTLPALPFIGDSVSIVVPVRNVGRESVPAFSVSVFKDANADSLPQPAELIGSVSHSIPLAPLDSATVMFEVGSIVSSLFIIARIEYSADEDTTNNTRFGQILAGFPGGSVRINEIMYAPIGTEPEWVEVFNTRSDSINLKGWLVSDNIVTSKRIITQQNAILPPAGYVVLARDSSALLDIHPNIAARVVHVSNLPTLNNSGDGVVLYDNRIATMDSIAYEAHWGGSNGNSLERIDAFASSTQQTNWGSSRNLARSTPGERNSISRKDRDLAVDSLRVSPLLPVVGDTLIIVVPIVNPGREAVSAYTIQLFKDANADSIPQPNEIVGSIVGSVLLAPLDSTTATFFVNAVQAGSHLFMGRVDFPLDEDSTNNLHRALVVVGYLSGSVRINEIMYAPVGGIPEWIELVNTTSDTVNLGTWSVGNRSPSSRYEIAGSSPHVPSNELVVITKDTALLHAAYPGAGTRFVQVTALPTFLWNNSGDAVVLSDNRRAIVDSLFYRSTWGGNSGKSLERIDAFGDANDSTNWATSADSLGATPARPNSQVLLDHDLRAVRILADTVAPGSHANLRIIIRNVGKIPSSQFMLRLFDDADGDSVGATGEQFHQQIVAQTLSPRDSATVSVEWMHPSSGIHHVVAEVDYTPDERLSNNRVLTSVRVGYSQRVLIINEIMYAPSTGSAEYVEFFNPGRDSINVAHWKCRDRRTSESVNEFTLSATPKWIHPGEYFVLASDSSILHMIAAEERLLTILNQSSLSLNNEGDEIVLVDPSDFTIDSVSYSPSWHNPNVADRTGRSLEKINALLPSNDQRNWSTCAQSTGGTPGTQNSIFAAVLPPRSKLTVSPNPFSPDGDGRDDFAVIQYELPLAVSMIRVRLYDVVGRRIRTLSNNEPSGSRGSVVWDGLDDEKQKARMGIYVILLEAIDDNGGVLETVKGVVVLAARL